MIVTSEFQPPAWLRNAHLQTLAAGMIRPMPRVRLRMERLELPDGDFLDLAWCDHGCESGSPTVVMLHGLGGGLDSKYARALMNAVHAQGYRAVLMVFRGQGHEPNRLARSYHSGETGDLGHVIETLRRREPHTPLAAVGYSLGGNVLLKYLGEHGVATPLVAAAAVSVPFDLALCARAIRRGFSRTYQARLLKAMRFAVQRKSRHIQFPVPLPDLRELRDFFEFDDAVTARVHGFRDVHHYYAEASSGQYLHRIRIPTLIVHAADDPFMYPSVVPKAEQLAASIRFELSAHGGHVGFIARGAGGRPYFWLEKRIPQFLAEYLPAAQSSLALVS